MEILDASEVAAKISSIIQSSPDRRITGVRLGVAIRADVPGFNTRLYRCRNLREFINQYALGVRQVSQHGPEVIYGLVGEAGPTPTAWKVPTQAWRTFTNPHAKYALYANLATYDLTTFPLSVSVGTPWVRVPSCSEDAHIQIAKDFLATIPDPVRELLDKALHEQQWWYGFAIEARRLGYHPQWSSFRHRELWKILLTSLDGLAAAGASSVSGELMRDQQSPEPKDGKTGQSSGRPLSVDYDETLRKVVLAIVGRMPLSELREMRLPVGDIVEALQGK
ncbi:MAG: hypothetical protein ABSB15_17035 [Bryobacteraceae bacterium]|jgi:hypothetical protein